MQYTHILVSTFQGPPTCSVLFSLHTVYGSLGMRLVYKCESSTASVLRWTLQEKASSLPLLSASTYVDFDVTHLLKFPRLFCVSGYYLASFPGSCAWAEKIEPGTHCSRMLSSPRISRNLEISCKTCSITLSSARHTDFSRLKDACH